MYGTQFTVTIFRHSVCTKEVFNIEISTSRALTNLGESTTLTQVRTIHYYRNDLWSNILISVTIEPGTNEDFSSGSNS